MTRFGNQLSALRDVHNGGDTATPCVSQEAFLLHVCSRLQSETGLSSSASASHVLPPADQGLLRQLTDSAPRLTSGSDIRVHLRDQLRLLPTGCSSLDQLLLGGLREGTVVECAGETASGKSQLCMSVAVVTAHRGERVMYVDTSNAFCPLRVLQLAQAWGQQLTNPLPAERVLHHITVVRLHDIYSLMALLEQLAVEAAAEEDSSQRPKLLVIDSVAGVVAPVLGHRQHKQSVVLVSTLGWLLRNITQRFGMAALVTNNAVGAGPGLSVGAGPTAAGSSSRPQGDASGQPEALRGATGLVKPALGQHWRTQAHTRLMLTRRDDVTTATLLTSSMAAAGAQACFCITDKGMASIGN